MIADAHATCDADVGGVRIPAAAIVAHTNRYFAGLRYPDQTFTVQTHDTVDM